ncbi:outer membrane protein assembly factor BamE [Halochromatium salexigens]|uniref:outer membrane protein assembly factor BamE n=1 Tax=Halochromatium salexigens TaxID=49447 RepID=UPI001F5DFED2|nr:outer membrane protein assembly factor BamE [Halochromatium salexigens]
MTLILAAALASTGCARGKKPNAPPSGSMLSNLPFVYKMTVQQGNVITERMVNQIQLGMNREQVRFVLGTPLLSDMFHTDRWDYIYTIRRGHAPMETKRLTLWFEDDQLVSVEGFARPNPTEALAALEDETVIVEVPDWQDDRGIINRTLNAVGLETAD